MEALSNASGLFDPWDNVLGMLGLFGPEDGCWAYVNVVTGNLVLNLNDTTPERSIDTCTYEGGSDRVLSLSRRNGSRDAVTVVRFTYEQVGTSSTFRIRTVTDARGTQTFVYHRPLSGRGRTDLIDVRGQTWTYVYDAGTSQLLEVHGPSANGERPVTTVHYDGQEMSLG